MTAFDLKSRPVDLQALVELREVHAGYDGVEVLRGINLSVPVGQVLAILGPNGAGKTTLMSTIAGLITPTSGELVFGGRPMTGVDPAALVRAGLCLVPEGRGVFANLTVSENLWLAANSGRSREQVEQRAFEVFPRLADRRVQLAGSLSGGEQQMLALSRALVTEPAVLLLDELSMGLAPLVVHDLYKRVAEIAESGVTVLVVEQFVRTVSDIADRGVALVGGRIILDGPISEISPQLHSAYFASSEETPR
ncbi:MAG TPA: ABC transporter ATP-binding protein [Microthrixaceae bacterium]|nr:ABC transporter ATP-binding protein [Microthrixaceae bacterium]